MSSAQPCDATTRHETKRDQRFLWKFVKEPVCGAVQYSRVLCSARTTLLPVEYLYSSTTTRSTTSYHGLLHNLYTDMYDASGVIYLVQYEIPTLYYYLLPTQGERPPTEISAPSDMRTPSYARTYARSTIERYIPILRENLSEQERTGGNLELRDHSGESGEGTSNLSIGVGRCLQRAQTELHTFCYFLPSCHGLVKDLLFEWVRRSNAGW